MLINGGLEFIVKKFHSYYQSDYFAVTKNNKKVKPLSNIFSDPTVYVWEDIAKLAKQNFTVNVDNLTQDMLDEIAVTLA